MEKEIRDFVSGFSWKQPASTRTTVSSRSFPAPRP
jgi:hypothetical protein